MELATIIHQYRGELEQRYGGRLLPGHRRALDAMLRCRTPKSGQVRWACHDCNRHRDHPLSCGHRSCPKCQNQEATQWLDRQRAKLLPVDYFMATFTLPAQLRALAWRHQRVVYALLCDCAVSTLKDFGMNPAKLGASTRPVVNCLKPSTRPRIRPPDNAHSKRSFRLISGLERTVPLYRIRNPRNSNPHPCRR